MSEEKVPYTTNDSTDSAPDTTSVGTAPLANIVLSRHVTFHYDQAHHELLITTKSEQVHLTPDKVMELLETLYSNRDDIIDAARALPEWARDPNAVNTLYAQHSKAELPTVLQVVELGQWTSTSDNPDDDEFYSYGKWAARDYNGNPVYEATQRVEVVKWLVSNGYHANDDGDHYTHE